MKKTTDSKSIYSHIELGIMTKVNTIKSKILHPIVILLDKLKISANMISFISASVAVIFLIQAINSNNPYLFLIGIWIHMLIDGLDGSLARYQKKDSKYGALVDVSFDHVGIITSVIYGIYFSLVNPINFSVYLFLYTLVIINSVIILFKKSRSDIVFRPRFYIYVTLVIDTIIFINFTNVVVLISNIFMFVAWIFGLIKIKSLNKK